MTRKVKILDVLVFVLLAAGVLTYAAPFMRVRVAGQSVQSVSYADVLEFLPKPPAKNASREIDFWELLEDILPGTRGRLSKDFNITRELVFAVTMPAALTIAYFLIFNAFLAAARGKRLSFTKNVLFAWVASGYVILAVHLLHRLVQESMAMRGKGVFKIASKLFSKTTVVEPAMGAYLLFGILSTALILSLMRNK